MDGPIFVPILAGVLILFMVISIMIRKSRERNIQDRGYTATAKVLAVEKQRVGKDSRSVRVYFEYQAQLEAHPRRCNISMDEFRAKDLSDEIKHIVGSISNIAEIAKRARESKAMYADLEDKGYSKKEILQTIEDMYSKPVVERQRLAKELGLNGRWEALLQPVNLPIVIDKEDPEKVIVDYRALPKKMFYT